MKYYTATDISKMLGIPITTVYSRFSYKNSPERWGVEVRRDERSRRYKYVVSEENIEKIWKGTPPREMLTENQKRILDLQND